MRSLSYLQAKTVREAIEAYAAAGEGARYIAGGTTLYDLMKLGVERPAHLVDIASLEGADRIDTSGDVLFFGAGALMADVAENDVVRRDYPVLAESLSKAASQQLRNMATVGGNLLQRTRCPYFRNGAIGAYPCNKRVPGSGCAAIGGLDRGQAVLGISNACTAVSPGDWPVALTAMDATVEIQGPAGPRSVPIAEFYRLPGDTPHLEFEIEAGEIVTGISVPKTEAGRNSTYLKVRDRESYAFALASAAVALAMDGDHVRQASIALGGVATRPWRAREAEALLNRRTIEPDIALAAGRAAFADARPGEHNAFKIELGARTLADAIMTAGRKMQ
ncbi:xanthine dehydrogenase family protein subunit M [Rhizobium laguerreae]|uniref:FAD binding domain-containing protein n=1 Tax=Rhizobium laguerreae TaxID=1076926 RepID=UPI001C924A29|nr:xanthine dehydrogenase family protein subunit M [Rhizobium laguerreae]MBY3473663.1 xanthine dehydrogenase family protein subunit M [Rhizobium laguerreae]MBY3521671.1 xanthine dehydrogenase family protein subunit M [Rhizobium laguerreae]